MRGVVALALLPVLASCAGQGQIEIGDARLGQPRGPNAALYFTASSGGVADELVDAETGIADRVEFHQTTTSADGTVSMDRIDVLELPAQGSLVLEPGGYHLMLIDVDRVDIGETVEITLVWRDAGEMTLTAEVVDPANTMTEGS